MATIAALALCVAPLRLAMAPTDDAKALEEAAEAEAAEPDPDQPDPITKSLIDDAVAHFKEGQRLYQDRQYLEAADEFRRSYESIPSGRALYNESLAWEKAGESARAMNTLERYLALEGCVSDELLCAGAERAQASRAAEKLKSQVGELDIVLEPGAKVRGVEIDGELHAVTAFPLYVEPGELEVVVVGTKEGQRRRFEVDVEAAKTFPLLVTKDVFVVGGGVKRPLSKFPEEETRDPPSTKVDPEVRRKRLRAAFYGSLGVTLASGAATAVVGGLLLDARRDYNRRCTNTGNECVPGEDRFPHDAQDRFDRLRPATTALMIVTSAFAITTVTLAIFAFVNPDRAQQRASTRAPKPGAQFTGNGLRVHW